MPTHHYLPIHHLIITKNAVLSHAIHVLVAAPPPHRIELGNGSRNDQLFFESFGLHMQEEGPVKKEHMQMQACILFSGKEDGRKRHPNT
jgi:hypothetical protein